MTMVKATAAAVMAGGPLLGLMCFSFVATVTLFLISLPLLLIFSPVLIGAVAVLAAAIVGFLVAGRQIGVGETMFARVKELGQDWSYYLWNKADDDSPQTHSS